MEYLTMNEWSMILTLSEISWLSYGTLQVIWFLLLGVLLAGYAILDGFDLGVGILHPFAKGDIERRLSLNSIGPLWDGNEVWLVTFGGALFAAFPDVYATIFSGFYIALMMLLTCIIFRAVSIEFRSKRPAKAWRTFWDFAFFLSSAVIPILYGVAVGNIMRGIPIADHREYAGGFFELLNPYAVCCGLMVFFTFAMHGAIYLYMKTEGEMQQRVKPKIWVTFIGFALMYIVVTVYTFIEVPAAIDNFHTIPAAWALVGVQALAFIGIPIFIFMKKPFLGFLSSCVVLSGYVFLLGIGLFPHMVRVHTVEGKPVAEAGIPDLSIHNASSSYDTLAIMLLIAVIGIPCVLSYTAAIYWVFRGKVKLDAHSY